MHNLHETIFIVFCRNLIVDNAPSVAVMLAEDDETRELSDVPHNLPDLMYIPTLKSLPQPTPPQSSSFRRTRASTSSSPPYRRVVFYSYTHELSCHPTTYYLSMMLCRGRRRQRPQFADNSNRHRTMSNSVREEQRSEKKRASPVGNIIV